ncbi:hypothetical protein SAMN05444422_11268 [Halobiforma haloterrestris]|uniref:Uncharacterized protein n=1 Tax=Natronobacterium haloterrestre TaxID=148448 RepID=A0A1I1KUN8_NATHA|nr:hypothetical protein [Halobiforma haloterrestris]SFC62448.1 hypothetical protein SAMN05444422_11268 [Halobiforma haloterrestris]
MVQPFVHAKPLQALKLGAILGVLGFGIAGVAGLFPDGGLDSLLIIAFFPMILALVVGTETLLAGYRLARADDSRGRLRSRPFYTAIRVLEVVATIGAPGTFYVLIVEVGSEVAGPGAIGLLLYGVGFGLLAFGAVVLRTLVEYYDHRQNRSTSGHIRDRNDISD